VGAQLVLVHGRAQEGKDPGALKAEWLDALNEGLEKSGLSLPVDPVDVRFPYYGDTLAQLTAGRSVDGVADVSMRGEAVDEDEQRFVCSVLAEVGAKAGVTPEDVAEAAGWDVLERGPLNWAWAQAVLTVLDRRVPYASAAAIALITRDVYAYLSRPVVREEIDAGVAAAITPGGATVVVAHSLGSVVAYNVLRRCGARRDWKVPLFVTVGSPLGVSRIREAVRQGASARCPECVGEWLNALDPRDVVALYPLDVECFPLDPARPEVVNMTHVRNRTENRHGITGYLDDVEVARRIYDALVG
jgi:hypothetical protein